MRNLVVFGSIFGLFGLMLSMQQPTYADIVTGTSQSSVDIETNVNGSGTTNTHIETDVNGNKHVYDSNQQGSVHIENNGTSYSEEVNQSSSSQSNASANATPRVNQPSPMPTQVSSQVIKPAQRTEKKNSNFLQELIQVIKNFFHIQ